MALDVKRYRFTRDDYHEMARAGILKPDVRVELIDGEIVEMNPIGRRHRGTVDRINAIFVPQLGLGRSSASRARSRSAITASLSRT